MTDPGLANKAVVVTGAASGLGRVTALAFAAAGARVAILDVDAAGLEDTAERMRDGGAQAVLLPCDLTDVAACRQSIGQAAAALGGIDVLCNVAGTLLVNHAPAVTPEAWDRVFAVNVRAPFFLFQAALPHLLERSGTVVNVASASAFLGCAYLSAYAASKAALVNLTKSLAMEFVNSPIRINAIAPGMMNTPMATPTGEVKDMDYGLVARYAGIRPANEPAEFTDLILYLASSRASAVHGACINIDGGSTA